jgi:L-ribulose-5-phosphate 3-epimerase
MKFGCRAHDFGKLPLEELAQKISNKGFTSIQLALAKAIPSIDCSLGHLSPGLANYIGEVFHNKGIRIAVLGCYINATHPDDVERKKLVNRFKEHLRFARDFGTSIVATETGSMNGDYSYHPENSSEKAFEIFIETVSEIVNEAEKFGVIACIEGVAKHVISTPQRMKRVLDKIKSNNLQILFDPVNYLTVENCKDQTKMMDEVFDLFGDKIQIIHSKDFKVEDNKIITLPPGKGNLDYAHLLKLIKSRKPYIDILIEDIKPEFMDEAKLFVEDIYNKV